MHNLEDLRALYGGAEVVELNKSYSSTYEITFAKRIRNVAMLEAVERHGDEPALIRCRNKEEELALIKAMTLTFMWLSLMRVCALSKSCNKLVE